MNYVKNLGVQTEYFLSIFNIFLFAIFNIHIISYAFIQGRVQTFLETEIVRLILFLTISSYTITHITHNTYYVLILEREENRSTRRKTLEAQERSTTGTQLT